MCPPHPEAVPCDGERALRRCRACRLEQRAGPEAGCRRRCPVPGGASLVKSREADAMSPHESVGASTGEIRAGLLDDGRTFAVLSAATFALKAIFVKLAYAAHPVDAVTLLALRMGIALPFFLWLARRSAALPKGP